ncbi:MAG TPA: methyltransferase domain-containing protein [Alphaproteobacteria bacterium]|nr:methyltransferase domain-containing protein [Alphaproteobacteria bacterium]
MSPTDTPASPRAALKKLVRASVPLTCVGYLVLDALDGLRLALGRVGTESGTTHATIPVEESVRYIEHVAESYAAAVGRARFEGTVAEIGPGDNLGVGLLLLARGAAEVHAIDRFRSERDETVQTPIYRALAEKHDLARLFDGAPAERNIRGVKYVYGVAAEDYFASLPPTYSAILSTAVMEHLLDPIRGLDGMMRALVPGGVLVHQIDLRDHGMFAGRHPLTFLTVPRAIFRRMVANSGRPNRVLLHRYKAWAAAAKIDCRFLVTNLAGREDGLGAPIPWDEIDPGLRATALETVRAMRPHLAREFAPVADADLAVSGFMMIASKPRAA